MKKKIFIVIFFVPFFSMSQQTNMYKPPLPEMSFAKIIDTAKFTGDRWSYMEAGSKSAPAIIMMHGYGGSSNDWRFQLHEFSKNFRAIAWNAPGYMLTDGLKTNKPSREDYANSLADFMNALKIEKAYLVGNSFGSRVAQCFAYHHPQRVIKIALVGPSAGKNLSKDEIAQMWDKRMNQIKDGALHFADKRVEALLAPGSSKELIELARSGMMGVQKDMFIKGVNFLVANDHTPSLIATKLTMPILLIAGTEDAISPIFSNTDSIKKAIPHSKVEILKGIGHLPHIEAPQTVNELVAQFFDAPLIQYNYRELTKRHIDSLTQLNVKWTLTQDTNSIKKYVPDDLMITNPFGQLINKNKMIERIKADIIKYSVFEKVIENYQFENDDLVVTQGLEKTVPATNSKRDDAGKLTMRRFTEVWVKRNNSWARITRHASNIN
ncbi:MAG: alpha/beta fold hydrolase [Ferruginibacter sp.]|nr:alpha/beta fold hydrolase [Ferruginibacter sp.]